MRENEVIDEFRGDYFFLSNFYPAKIVTSYSPYFSETYEFFSSEVLFQSIKMKNKVEFDHIRTLDSRMAKNKSKKFEIRHDWLNIRDSVMKFALECKFNQNPELIDKLVSTYPKKLVEGNVWKDTYWGVCKNVGKNKLGVFLEELRLSYLFF